MNVNDSQNLSNTLPSLRNLRIKNPKNVIIAHVNINSIRNKFDFLKEFVEKNIDILCICETKVDSSFPVGQFDMPGFKLPFRRDRDKNGGGLMIFANENLLTKELTSFKVQNGIELITLEINLRKKKYLLLYTYRPPSQCTHFFLSNITNALNFHMRHYSNIIVMGDFNLEPDSDEMSEFMSAFDLSNLIKEKTCFKSASNPSCIDLILTNIGRTFKHTSTIETGLSDFHRMVLTVMKTTYVKAPPKVVNYHDYSHFNKEIFISELTNRMQNITTYEQFHNTFKNILHNHMPLKKKILRSNNKPFMNKNLRKAIMLRSRLRNKSISSPSAENIKQYKLQRNLCVKLSRKAKFTYYSNLNTKKITDNKCFWRTVKPFVSDDSSNQKKIILIENECIISSDEDIANIFNSYFQKVISSLKLYRWPDVSTDSHDYVLNAIYKYELHPSIQKINERYNHIARFEFSPTTGSEMWEEMKKLDESKSNVAGDIPSRILKDYYSLYYQSLVSIFNNTVIKDSEFPNELKCAEVCPIFKKGDPSAKENFRPISILPVVSKIFEKLLYKQLMGFFCDKLSPYLCGFRKGFSTQQSLLRMFSKVRGALDAKQKVGAIFMDLSKAFDCISHDLLIAKLYAYGLSFSALKLVASYLKNRKQRIRLANSFSEWLEMTFGVPQGSVLGPLLFNIFLNDFLSFVTSDICNYADDNTIYVIGNSEENILYELENEMRTVSTWFRLNCLQLNERKCHFMFFGSNTQCFLQVNINGTAVQCSSEEKLLGITIDNMLTFSKHVKDLCKKASNKLNALVRLSPYMDQQKLYLILNSFILSQFGYCPLLWMFCNRTTNNSINRIHSRALRVITNDYNSSFQDLLDKTGTVSVHHRNLIILLKELYKVKNNTNPDIMSEVFILNKNRYSNRINSEFFRGRAQTVKYGLETVTFRGPQLWATLPKSIQEAPCISTFVSCLKKWKGLTCQCRLCRLYIHNLGYI